MINKIRYTEKLKPYITDKCEENKISVTRDSNILPENYLVIKVDQYYNSLRLSDTPPSVDCVIILKCADNSFMIYLIELKRTKSLSKIKGDIIRNKFKTTIKDFMEIRFQEIFLNEQYIIKDLKLFLISKSKIPRLKEGTTKIDRLLSEKPFEFKGKGIHQIKHELPNPIIQKC